MFGFVVFNQNNFNNEIYRFIRWYGIFAREPDLVGVHNFPIGTVLSEKSWSKKTVQI